MFTAGFIIFIVSLISFFAAIIWLVSTLISKDKASRRKALKLLVAASLGLLISFPLCTMGFGNYNMH